jgi:hypothetical protein
MIRHLPPPTWICLRKKFQGGKHTKNAVGEWGRGERTKHEHE